MCTTLEPAHACLCGRHCQPSTSVMARQLCRGPWPCTAACIDPAGFSAQYEIPTSVLQALYGFKPRADERCRSSRPARSAVPFSNGLIASSAHHHSYVGAARRFAAAVEG